MISQTSACQITATNTQFDRLVYDLYGLTEEEIKIVETDNGSKKKPFSLQKH